MRAALHAHVLCWHKLRDEKERDEKRKKEGKDPYRALPSVPRIVPGTKPRQRPSSQKVPKVTQHQEDDMYHRAHVGRVNAEMVRPDVGGSNFGGYDFEMMRIAGLARAVLNSSGRVLNTTHVKIKTSNYMCFCRGECFCRGKLFLLSFYYM